MRKIFLILFLVLLICTCNITSAKTTNNSIENIISNSRIDMSQIAISVKDADSGKVVYAINESMLIPPASVQKMLTIIPIAASLGLDYKYTTKLYSKNNNTEYLIKLGADPYLKTNDLKKLVKNILPSVRKICIDDSIVENKDWGEGWQWDDAFNPLMPRFNSYNLDNNIIKLSLFPVDESSVIHVVNTTGYPLAIINNLSYGDDNSVKISKENSLVDNMIKLEGKLNKQISIYFPVDNLNRYFNIKLNKLLEERNIYLKDDFIVANVSEDYTLIDEVAHSFSSGINDILKNSNNIVAETSLKLAGANSFGTVGTDKNGIKLFYNYCNSIGLDTSDIKITDASGVSKNNLMNADFITEFLLKNKENEIYNTLPKPGEGTLANRMITLKTNLRAKTGTLSNISSIAGFLKTKAENNLVFCVMTNSPNASISDLKILEDYIIRELYLKF
ncbi:D-alanyl-D-alanine carboxypeptidase/D-alanyl-D-alanine-endopeptidase [bacterium]|nr:D-alanyl-D-alanine carboxypeptidase/D-alanyl-D-alanine-endopeptidase [bacterium]